MTKLLVIDDEIPFLEVLETSLSSEGYDVMTAENGEEGLKIFEQRKPKLVLTDIKMPGIDGIEVLRRIKTIDSQAEVIVITGHGDMDSAIAALQHGASDFITKPVRGDKLRLALDRAEKKIAIELKSNIQMFKWLHAIDEKGEDNARWSCGLMAQNVRDIFKKHGLDAGDYSLYCTSTDENGETHYGLRPSQILYFIIASM